MHSALHHVARPHPLHRDASACRPLHLPLGRSPGEIRNTIYSYALLAHAGAVYICAAKDERGRSVTYHAAAALRHHCTLAPNLLLANKQTCANGCALLYRDRTIHFESTRALYFFLRRDTRPLVCDVVVEFHSRYFYQKAFDAPVGAENLRSGEIRGLELDEVRKFFRAAWHWLESLGTSRGGLRLWTVPGEGKC